MIRSNTRAMPVVILLAVATTSGLQAQERMRAGMWEKTISSPNGQTATRSTCMTPAEAAQSNGSSVVTRAEAEKAMVKSGCTLKDYKLDGNTVTSTMVCEGSTILSETTFHGGDSYEEKITFTGGVTRMKGRRTGPC